MPRPPFVEVNTWGARVAPGTPIAAFDLDGTLVEVKTPRSRKVRPEDASDWNFIPARRFGDPESGEAFPAHDVSETLRALRARGYAIAILTNQSPRSKKSATEGAAIARAILQSVADALPDIPLLLLGATGYDVFRKPMTGLWRIALARAGRSGAAVRNEKDFYCGDAAGRKGDFKTRGNHARSDLAFAANAGIRFVTPEYFFTVSSHRTPPALSRPARRIGSRDLAAFAARLMGGARARGAKIIAPVGLPGCGKSSLAGFLAELGAVVVSQDTAGKKFKGLLSAAVSQGHVVVADRTNLKIEERAYLRAAAVTLFVDMLEYVPEPSGDFRIGDGAAWHWNCVRGEAGGRFVSKIAVATLKKTAVAVGTAPGEHDVLFVRAPPVIAADDHRFFDNVPA